MPSHIIATVKLNKDAFQGSSVQGKGGRKGGEAGRREGITKILGKSENCFRHLKAAPNNRLILNTVPDL